MKKDEIKKVIMIIAFDVQYADNQAKAVAIAFQNWEDAAPNETIIKHVDGIAEYEPGAFYKRELPCILSILQDIDLTTIDLIVVDGYVLLDDFGKLGLGGHLYEALVVKIPIIGVAKTKFLQNSQNAIEVFRGKSQKPLFVSAVGIHLEMAAEAVQKMHGNFRFPTLLKLLDDVTKEKV
jgi:deoxyribonuclease V